MSQKHMCVRPARDDRGILFIRVTSAEESPPVIASSYVTCRIGRPPKTIDRSVITAQSGAWSNGQVAFGIVDHDPEKCLAAVMSSAKESNPDPHDGEDQERPDDQFGDECPR